MSDNGTWMVVARLRDGRDTLIGFASDPAAADRMIAECERSGCGWDDVEEIYSELVSEHNAQSSRTTKAGAMYREGWA